MTDDSIDPLLGDLTEEYAIRVKAHGRLRAASWYCRELAMLLLHAGGRTIGGATAAGLLTGLCAMAISMNVTRGPLMLFPIALLILTLVATLRTVRRPALRRAVVFSGVVTAILVPYLGSVLFDPRVASISLTGHGWRLAFVIAVAVATTLSVTEIAPGIASRPYAFAVAMGVFGSGALWITLLTGRRVALLAVVLAALLLATGLYLKRKRIEPFRERLIVPLIVCTIITALSSLFLLFIVNPSEAGRSSWYALQQNGLLYAEIAAASVLIAALTKSRPTSATNTTP